MIPGAIVSNALFIVCLLSFTDKHKASHTTVLHSLIFWYSIISRKIAFKNSIGQKKIMKDESKIINKI